MNDTQLERRLRECRDQVDVPPLDLRPVAARTRQLRRRRRARRAVGGVVVLAALVTGATVVPGLLEEDRRGVEPAAVPAVAADGIPVVLDGRVQLVARDGSVRDTGRAGSVVGVWDGSVVVLDGGVLSAGDRQVSGVATAYADPAGVTYQRTDGTVGRLGAGGVDPAGAGDLVAAGANGLARLDGAALVVVDTAGAHGVRLGSDGAAAATTSTQVAGDTLVVTDGSTVQFFDLDGSRRAGILGGTTGTLSEDGDSYAYAPTRADLGAGMRPGLTWIDTTTQATRRTALPGAAVGLTWSADVVHVVTEDAGARTLWACATTCERVLTDPGGTLALR